MEIIKVMEVEAEGVMGEVVVMERVVLVGGDGGGCDGEGGAGRR